MDPSVSTSVSSLANPKTMPIRRGHVQAPNPIDPAQANSATGETPVSDSVVKTEAAPAIDIDTCPRCGGKLVNPQELGWCPKCSYCRSLEKDQATAKLATEAAPAKSVASRFGEYGELIAKIPSWGWIAAGGVLLILELAFVANYFLPLEESLARGLISIIVIVVSIVTIFGVNLWSLFMLADADERLGPKDVFLFFGLWARICEKLPMMRRQFWLILWCLTAVICAIFVVDGLEYWWDLYKPKKAAKTDLVAAASALAKGEKGSNKSLAEAVEDFAKKQDLKAKLDEKNKKDKPAPRQATHCVVVGYTLSSDGELDGLVVASLLNDRVRYAGIVHKGFDPKQAKELLTALKPLIQPKSYIPGLSLQATWVKPAVFCEISHEDYDENQHFIAPEFKTLLSDNR